MSPVIIKVPSNDSTIVATKSVTDQTVVAHGRNIRTVMNKATKAGVKNPILSFVPRENARYVF
jgi:hypothetical protein